jgi:hypothetical protein
LVPGCVPNVGNQTGWQPDVCADIDEGDGETPSADTFDDECGVRDCALAPRVPAVSTAAHAKPIHANRTDEQR